MFLLIPIADSMYRDKVVFSPKMAKMVIRLSSLIILAK